MINQPEPAEGLRRKDLIYNSVYLYPVITEMITSQGGDQAEEVV